MDEIEDSYEIIMKVLCNESDKKDVIQSIKDWYYGHHIGMSDLKIYTEAQPYQRQSGLEGLKNEVEGYWSRLEEIKRT